MDLETWIRWPVLIAYFAILLLLSGYGLHRWYLLWLFRKHRDAGAAPPDRFPDDALPTVTVQLPMYNERYVARRLIEAVCRLDYPRDRLEIQVLDDSTDDTRDLAREAVEAARARGFDIHHVHREDRSGFKAGALDAGLAVARGELVAVFDADFVPDPAFLRRLVDDFTDPRVGMVQARWGHLNREHSPLTRVQAMFLDGHFVIEHTARNRSGRFFNFNGTAGIWRRRCIDDAGGWQHDTLTEDLDLSYRAQMRGWRFVYRPDHVAPAELPEEMAAFKSQQHRWAKGSIQTARKLLPRLLASDLPRRVKVEATFHLTANVGYVLMVALALLVGPAVWLRRDISPWLLAGVDLPLFTLSSVSVAAFYVVAHRVALGPGRRPLRWIPFLMAVGIGLSINNARAVLEALAGRVSEFRRTPKHALARGESLRRRTYRGRANRDTWIELALAVYFVGVVVVAAGTGLWAAIPFLTLFLVGYLYTATTTLAQSGERAG
jgi:cellulose synthase/poly-beta-1,6-N-acetylglucosamine synthase-like glycosyltransferase